jgi:hypothetical protein
MQECIEDFVPRAAYRDRSDVWWINNKMSDDFLDRLFETYFQKLGIPNLMHKTDYHELARFVPRDLIAYEVEQVLSAIYATSRAANPAQD